MRQKLSVWQFSIIGCTLLVGASSLLAQNQGGTGQIQGTIVSQGNQAVAKAAVVIQRKVSGNAAPFQASTLTAADGTFAFAEVPSGTFTICVQVPGSDFLNPCTWSKNPPTVPVGSRQIASAGRIRLDQGQLLKVRLNDATRVLQADEGKVRGAQVLIGIWTPSGLFVPMRIRTKSVASRNLEIPIPIGQQLQLSVNSSYFDLTDENNAKLDVAKGFSLPIQSSATAALRLYTFNVTGRRAIPPRQ